MNKVSAEMIQDWTENPVTEFLADLVKDELSDIQNIPIVDALVYGNPTQTHENLVNLEAREMVWSDVLRVLTGDWTFFEEEENE